MVMMAPSRGADIEVTQQQNSALVTAKRNFKFLLDPSSSDKPARVRTRALLRFIRSAGQFILWRLVRWAKYAAVGAIVTAIGATAFGSVVSGAAWVLAPPSIGASIIAASVWGTGKYFAKRLHGRWQAGGGDVGEEARERAEDSGSTVDVRAGRGLGTERGPAAVPW